MLRTLLEIDLRAVCWPEPEQSFVFAIMYVQIGSQIGSRLRVDDTIIKRWCIWISIYRTSRGVPVPSTSSTTSSPRNTGLAFGFSALVPSLLNVGAFHAHCEDLRQQVCVAQISCSLFCSTRNLYDFLFPSFERVGQGTTAINPYVLPSTFMLFGRRLPSYCATTVPLASAKKPTAQHGKQIRTSSSKALNQLVAPP